MAERHQIDDYLSLMICSEMCRSVIFVDPTPFGIHAHGPLMVSMQCASACDQPRNGRKLTRGAQYHSLSLTRFGVLQIAMFSILRRSLDRCYRYDSVFLPKAEQRAAVKPKHCPAREGPNL